MKILHLLFFLAFLIFPPAGPLRAESPRTNVIGPDTLENAAYSDDKRSFQGIPSIERSPGGRLWAAWYGGGAGEGRENHVIMESSDDGGRKWDRRFVIDPDGKGHIRAFDPCLWTDPTGMLWIFWAQDRPVQTWTMTASNPDAKHPDWTPPRPIGEGIMLNKPTVTRNGAWLLPPACWKTKESARVLTSADGGASFEKQGAASVPVETDRNCDEHMIVEKKDGSLWMLVRTAYGIGESGSRDGGATWSDIAPSGIPHLAARFFIRRLKSGHLLLVRHNVPPGSKVRSNLAAFLSEDDGRTWIGGLPLDERANVTYPDGVETPDGLIHIIYDFERYKTRQILMASIREEDIRAGAIVSRDAALRVPVNQATGPMPPPQGKKPGKPG